MRGPRRGERVPAAVTAQEATAATTATTPRRVYRLGRRTREKEKMFFFFSREYIGSAPKKEMLICGCADDVRWAHDTNMYDNVFRKLVR